MAEGAGMAARLAMASIRAYQLTLSALIGRSCRFAPSCSEYGREAIARHGLWTGGWLAVFRLARCRPGGGHGFDPVPQAVADPGWRVWRLRRHAAAERETPAD